MTASLARRRISPTVVGEATTARAISRWLRLPSWCRRNTSRILRIGNLLNAMWASTKSPRVPRLPRELRYDFGLSSLPWNQCPACVGITVQLALESVSSLSRNSQFLLAQPLPRAFSDPGGGLNYEFATHRRHMDSGLMLAQSVTFSVKRRSRFRETPVTIP